MTDLCKVTQLISSTARIRISVVSPLMQIFVTLNTTIRLHLNLVVYNRNSKRINLMCKKVLLIHYIQSVLFAWKERTDLDSLSGFLLRLFQFLFTSFSFVWLNNKKKPAMVLIVQQEQILEPGEVNLSVSTTIFEMQIISK